MFRAIGRYLRAVMLGFTGTVAKKAEGVSNTEVESDEEYKYCFEHFNRCTTKLEHRIVELEEDVEGIAEQITKNERILQRLLSELKEEAEDAIMEVIAANEEQKKADALTGLSEDRFAKQLSEMREVRQKARADARVATKLADLDTQDAKEKLMMINSVSWGPSSSCSGDNRKSSFSVTLGNLGGFNLSLSFSGVARQEFKSIGLTEPEALIEAAVGPGSYSWLLYGKNHMKKMQMAEALELYGVFFAAALGKFTREVVEVPLTVEKVTKALEVYGEPFAKALATFIKECPIGNETSGKSV